MNNSILSVTFSFAIFLNATATFAGQWTEVPGGAAPHPSALNGIAAVSANDIWAVGSWGQNGGRELIEHWDERTGQWPHSCLREAYFSELRRGHQVMFGLLVRFQGWGKYRPSWNIGMVSNGS